MKNEMSLMRKAGLLLCTATLFFSCQDYLDKAPEAGVSDKDIFSKFFAYQGFVEDMYEFVVDPANRDMHNKSNWNWGDDLTGSDEDRMGDFTDKGNYWRATWDTYVSPFSFSYTAEGNDGGDLHNPERNYWGHGWYGIRRANIALNKLSLMVEPYVPQGYEDTDQAVLLQEQKDLIKGQALFFRGYFHWEIIRAWGGMPYVKKVFSPSDVMREPRLSYQRTADSISVDLQEAARLLPADWNETITGHVTLNMNEGRLTKGAAYALDGKNLLYAASPLMNGVSTGSYEYNLDYCERAAKSFNEVFKLADAGYYGLIPVPYSSEPTEWAIQDENGATLYLDCSEFCKNFYTTQDNSPVTKETVFNHTINGNTTWAMGVHYMKEFGGFNCHASPTANYVEYFGMADGSRFKVDPRNASTWDDYDSDCWNKRDPRFYFNIVKDGDKMSDFDTGLTMNPPKPGQNYAQLYSIAWKDPNEPDAMAGAGRDFSGGASSTGYSWKKFYPFRRNKYDDGFERYMYTMTCPKIRLADVYLMYAEAVNEKYGPNVVPTWGTLSALDAVNLVRARFHVPEVPTVDCSDKLTFRETIRRERAVELAFENHRWYDIRRWHIMGESYIRDRYKLEFDHDHTIFRRTLVSQFPFDDKHYWMPIRETDAELYPSFPQNPGWQ